jgi:hypothetical protein
MSGRPVTIGRHYRHAGKAVASVSSKARRATTERKVTPVKCEVCDGLGDYPIIDNRGSTRYYIRCPECFGHGSIEDEGEPKEEPDLPPRSSAASITSMDELRDHVARHWSRTSVARD